ncbi:hypothetical protein B0H66DRAFT_615058 [Apodospora peruviana]|uniref:Uncharacterized protein n=1 Tax=Apodospora peruviana TaxID=516989 RepID=A0AAE0IGY4_9PEZI|nr:hypothetical protein B0H66DRAFT_615058 [Apodospora peruviana]
MWEGDNCPHDKCGYCCELINYRAPRAGRVGHGSLSAQQQSGEIDAAVPVVPFSDSSYASMLQPPPKAAVPQLETTAEEPECLCNISEDVRQDKDAAETSTLYSTVDSVASVEHDVYISELADKLLDSIPSVAKDVAALGDLSETLPSLLQAFALLIGHASETKTEREVMVFIHKHRRRGQVSHRGLLSDLEVETHVEVPPSEELPEGDAGIHSTLQNIEDDPPTLRPDRACYRDIVTTSKASEWLPSAMARVLLLKPVGENEAMSRIRAKILTALATPKNNMTFIVRLPALLHPYFPHTERGRLNLGRTIVLTGGLTDAQALPCADYVQQTWPWSGSDVLGAVQETVVEGKPTTQFLSDNSSLLCTLNPETNTLAVETRGTPDFIAEVGEVLAWLNAVLQPSHLTTGVTSLVLHHDVFSDAQGVQVTSLTIGKCWHALFNNPVVVNGFPIPWRSSLPVDAGLDIPLEMMAALAQAPRVNDFLGLVCLKGFSTMLVPMRRTDEIILWHLYYTEDRDRISYLHCSNDVGCRVTLTEMVAARHVLGWCSPADYHAGKCNISFTTTISDIQCRVLWRRSLTMTVTGAAGVNYDIRGSTYQQPSRDISLEKVSLSLGELVSGGCQVAIGRKDVPVRISKQGYITKLRWIQQKRFVFWDEIDKPGWLVNGNSTLLHLLRSSLHHSSTDDFSSEFIFKHGELQEAASPLQAKSAIQVLLNKTNRQRKLYPIKEEIHTETIKYEDGRKEMVTTTTTKYMTLEDRVEKVFDSREKLIDHKTVVEHGYKGVDVKIRARRHLEGWDFRDIATGRDPFHLKVARLPVFGWGWVDFTRTIGAVTLFGRGFGSLLSPSSSSSSDNTCLEWAAVPVDKYLLAASGKTASKLQHLNAIQELYPTKVRGLLASRRQPPDLDVAKLGAVVFGYRPASKWFWPEFGDCMVEKSCLEELQSSESESPAQALASLTVEETVASSGSSSSFQGSSNPMTIQITNTSQSQSASLLTPNTTLSDGKDGFDEASGRMDALTTLKSDEVQGENSKKPIVRRVAKATTDLFKRRKQDG